MMMGRSALHRSQSNLASGERMSLPRSSSDHR
jgi:hypothetical protein